MKNKLGKIDKDLCKKLALSVSVKDSSIKKAQLDQSKVFTTKADF